MIAPAPASSMCINRGERGRGEGGFNLKSLETWKIVQADPLCTKEKENRAICAGHAKVTRVKYSYSRYFSSSMDARWKKKLGTRGLKFGRSKFRYYKVCGIGIGEKAIGVTRGGRSSNSERGIDR